MGEAPVQATTLEYVPSLRAALDEVARERRYIAMVEAPPVDDVMAFVSWLNAGAGCQYIALDQSGAVIGWCDVVRNSREGFRHSGQLGMGVVASFRRQGIGRRLLSSTLARAVELGMTRVELEVFSSNAGAIALYRSLGFVPEGRKLGARSLDGMIDDVDVMAWRVSL